MEIYGKKLADGDYTSNSHDFVGEHELTVRITLHEYRELVKKDERCWVLEKEIIDLKHRLQDMELYVGEVDSSRNDIAPDPGKDEGLTFVSLDDVPDPIPFEDHDPEFD